MFVYIGLGGVIGVSAEKEDLGALLWETTRWFPSQQGSPSPVQISPNRMFVSAGYGAGAAMLQVDRQGNSWTATVERWEANRGASGDQHTPIVYNNVLITILPKNAGENHQRIAHYSLTNLRTPVWTSEPDIRFGLGPYIVINNHLFALTDTGELRVYEILQQGMRFVKQQRLFESIEARGPLAYADGILLLGDMHVIKALKIAEN